MQLLSKFALISVILLIPLTVIILFISSDSFKNFLKETINSLNDLPLFFNITFLVLIGVILIVVGLPISYFEFLLGFSLKSAPSAFFIEFSLKILATFVTYFLAIKLLKTYILSKYRQKSFFKGMKLFLENRKCLHLLCLRLLFIPLFLKNYLLPIFDISPILYFTVTLIVDVLAGFWMVFMGIQVREFSDSETKNYAETIRFVIFLGLSILIIIYILVFTRRKMKEFERLDNKEDVELELN